MTAAVIEARGLRKRYGATLALDGVGFSIRPGRIVGLIGPNGAGKTTALKAILGLTPVEGELRVLGLDPFRQRERLMEQVCFIADVAVLPRWIRVGELIDYVEGVHPRFDRRTCERILAQTEVRPRLKVRELSKGMIVQTHLALVLAIDARLLVLDEPTLGLDVLFRKRFYEQLLGDYFDQNRTILITTHQVEEVEPLLTDVLFIQRGRIVLDAALDELRDRFLAVTVDEAELTAARRLGPIHERRLFGRTVCVYDRVEAERLEVFGPPAPVPLADLFVALMTPTTPESPA